MPDPVTDFRDALERVPAVLLGAEDARILTDAITSADVLENLVSVPRTVVIVGSTGVGKSHLVNGLVAAEASREGPLRPTTRSIVMVGSSGPAPIGHASEYVLTSSAPDGWVFVDTPPWESDGEAVEAALAVADLGVLVVSPTRYGDASTQHIWESMEAVPARALVLNRLGGTADERSEIVSDISQRFGVRPLAIVDEGGDPSILLDSVLERVPLDDTDETKAAIARSAAASAGRHIAGVTTAAAVDVGALSNVIDEAAPRRIPGTGLAVLESWLATEQRILEHVRRSVDELDARVVRDGPTALGQRVLHLLGPWDEIETRSVLTRWRDEAAERFVTDARIRWRRSSTEQLLGKSSWKAGVNPSVHLPRRVGRVMGPKLQTAIQDLHEGLLSAADAAAERRKQDWKSIVQIAGEYTPGELLAASEAVEPR